MARKPPRLCYHRGQRRYYVTLGGREHYLGPPQPKRRTEPPEVRREYERLVGEYLAGRARPAPPAAKGLTVAELVVAYREHAARRYRKGARTEPKTIKAALAPVAELYGATLASDFGPRALAAVRDRYAALGWERGHVNAQVRRVRGMFRWAVSMELVPDTVWLRLKTLPGLRAGEYGLREAAPVADVPDAVIEATLPAMPPDLARLVQVHRLIGCRSDEVCQMTPAMLERLPDPESPTGETWRYTPAESKTGERYWVGPKAQALLLPLLEAAAPDEPLFVSRRGLAYNRNSYYQAVGRAAKRAGVPHWYPLNIRHRAAEEARQGHEKGIEAVQARLRHAEVSVSQVYASNRDNLGRDVARRFG